MEAPKEMPMTPEALKWYNLAQICVITYQKVMGLIKSDEEYVVGTAELFHMIANRIVTFDREFNWNKLRQEVELITRPTQEKVLSVAK